LCAERLPVAHPGTRPRAYPQRAPSGREALAGRHLLRQRPHKRHLGPLSPSPAQQRRASPRTAGWSGVVTATSVRRGSVILTIVASSRFRRRAILDARPLDVDLGFPAAVSSRGRCSRRRAGREWASAARSSACAGGVLRICHGTNSRRRHRLAAVDDRDTRDHLGHRPCLVCTV
jgi:hypothetical protein